MCHDKMTYISPLSLFSTYSLINMIRTINFVFRQTTFLRYTLNTLICTEPFRNIMFNMINNFKETVKIYEQGKKYYDALKSVNNLVKDARKVQQTILMVGDITDIYVNSFQRMLRDGNFRPEELSAIAFGYTKLLEESNEVLTELKNVVNITTLSMTDKERMDVVERCYSKMKRYRNLVSYYTNKNISVSYLRAKKKNDLDRIMGLYGKSNEKYW